MNPVWARDDNFQTLRQKAIALLHKASILSGQLKAGTHRCSSLHKNTGGTTYFAVIGLPIGPNLWLEISITCQATLSFVYSLPEFQLPEDMGDVDDPEAVRSILAIAFAAANSAVIQVHEIFAKADPIAREEQVNATRRAMKIVKEMSMAPPSYIPHFFEVSRLFFFQVETVMYEPISFVLVVGIITRA